MALQQLFSQNNIYDQRYDLFCNSLTCNDLTISNIDDNTGLITTTFDTIGSAPITGLTVRGGVPNPPLTIFISYTKVGDIVTLTIPQFVITAVGAGAGITMYQTVTPLPTALWPTFKKSTVVWAENGTAPTIPVTFILQVMTDGTLRFSQSFFVPGGSTTLGPNSGFYSDLTISYSVQP